MRNRVRIHPALKHGAYAASAVLPGESRAAFEKLHRDLIAELSPNGALEEDAVASIARLVWRKQNLQTLRIAERARGHSLKIRNEKLNAEVMRALIEDYDELQEEKRAGEDQAREEFGESFKLVELDHATLGGLTEDLGFQERLDGMIDRCLKRLLFLRGLKSISAAPSSARPQRVPKPREGNEVPAWVALKHSALVKMFHASVADRNNA